KEERDVLSKWGNDLRQSYRTLAQAAGVSELDIHLLMNHSLPGVNAGYITRDRLLRDHLRQQQQRISELVVRSCAVEQDPLLVQWLGSGKIEEGRDWGRKSTRHDVDGRIESDPWPLRSPRKAFALSRRKHGFDSRRARQ